MSTRTTVDSLYLRIQVDFLNEFSAATGIGRWASNDGWGDVDEATELFKTPTDVSEWFGITCAKVISDDEDDDGPATRGAIKKKKKKKKRNKGPKKRGPVRNLFLDTNGLQVHPFGHTLSFNLSFVSFFSAFVVFVLVLKCARFSLVSVHTPSICFFSFGVML